MFWSEFDPNRDARARKRMKRLRRREARRLAEMILKRQSASSAPMTRCTKATCEHCGRHGVVLHDRKATHGKCYGCGRQVKVQDVAVVRGLKRAAAAASRFFRRIGGRKS